MTQYNLLFYVGIAVMGASVIGGLAALVVRRQAGKRLRDLLNKEYGRKRR